ncbi:MAG TPA: AAA family ATPase [Pirellulales bacterium]|nr:AAA family ATPase [Pirellulales bacterium]
MDNIAKPATTEPAKRNSPPSVPDWYPNWAKELADLYFSGTTCLFVLNGNVHDLIPGRAVDGKAETYANLAEFLATQVFGTWDIVLDHDLGRGLRPLAGGDSARLKSMLSHLSGRLGEIHSWPRDTDQILALLDRFIERSLVDDAESRKRIAIIFDYAQYLVPAGDPAAMARGDAGRLVRMLGWAQNPYIKRANVAFCLVSEKLTEINDRLVQNPHVAAIKIPMPDRDQRERFVRWVRGPAHQGEAPARQASETAGPPSDPLAEMTSGLSLVSLNVLVSQGKRDAASAGAGAGAGADATQFKQLKKTLIERQCQGLVEFVEPKHTLDMVVGHEACRRRLREDALWIGRGQLDAAPMGYLITGPVGTGKTFLAECYAGSIGIPCVTLRNFRSKYVGETEGNLEQVLTVLRSLGPVVVIIDEADAALGNRRAEGDSGTSSRVFSMIAGQMGDTSYRGKIVWMLLTSRPDLLPIDLKRQGRAEVHMPLFYPREPAEFAAMFQVMARKNKITLAADAVVEVPADRHLSGADIESVVLAAKRAALTDGRGELVRADLQQALDEFIPSAQGLEKELQEIAAVLECTQLSFLPERWKAKVSEPNGRSQLQERMVAIRQLLEE